MKKQSQKHNHQDYLDILLVALKAETYSILDTARIDKILYRVKNNLGFIEDLSKRKRKGATEKIEKNGTTFWYFCFIAFFLLTVKIVIENAIYKGH